MQSTTPLSADAPPPVIKNESQLAAELPPDQRALAYPDPDLDPALRREITRACWDAEGAAMESPGYLSLQEQLDAMDLTGVEIGDQKWEAMQELMTAQEAIVNLYVERVGEKYGLSLDETQYIYSQGILAGDRKDD